MSAKGLMVGQNGRDFSSCYQTPLCQSWNLRLTKGQLQVLW